MKTLRLHLDDLSVETFEPLPPPRSHAGTVRGYDREGKTDSCPGNFTCDNKTCGEKTCDSCPDTCKPTCGGEGTCGGFTCEGNCPSVQPR
jgi:hypothetical protein